MVGLSLVGVEDLMVILTWFLWLRGREVRRSNLENCTRCLDMRGDGER